MRLPVTAVLAGVVAVVGVAGLIRGAVPQQAVAAPAGTKAVVVSGAWVREPASPDTAAAYFTVTNTTDAADRLTGVVTGAGREAVVHADAADGTMQADPAGLLVAAHSSVTLSPGRGHVMIEQLYGPLRAGQTVNLELTFATAGTLIVTAPVIAFGAPTPGAGPS